MGLAILVLFLLAWAVVLGGPMLGRFLRSRQDSPRDPFGDPFAALGRSVERSEELQPRRPGRPSADPLDADPGFEVPTAPVPRLDVPVEPTVVSIGAGDAPVPAELRRRRAVLVLVGAAAALLLLAILTGSIALWALQLLVDVLFVAYTVALVRHAHPPRAPAERSETFAEVLARGRRFALPALAVVAVGAIVFGGVVLVSDGDDQSNDRASAAVDDSGAKQSASSAAVGTPRTTTSVTVPPSTAAPATTTATTPVTSPATTRPVFPARTLPPITTAAPPVMPVLGPAPPPGTQPPPETQPPNLLCVLVQALC